MLAFDIACVRVYAWRIPAGRSHAIYQLLAFDKCCRCDGHAPHADVQERPRVAANM